MNPSNSFALLERRGKNSQIDRQNYLAPPIVLFGFPPLLQ